MAAKKGATAFNKQIGKVKRDGKIAEQPKYSKLERMKSNNTDPEPQDHVSHIFIQYDSYSMSHTVLSLRSTKQPLNLNFSIFIRWTKQPGLLWVHGKRQKHLVQRQIPIIIKTNSV